MKDILECTQVILELLVLENIDQSLRVSTSMSIAIPIEDFWELEIVLMSKEKNVFTEILLGITIWNGSKKERSNVDISIMT